jgi:hypothetical protein
MCCALGVIHDRSPWGASHRHRRFESAKPCDKAKDQERCVHLADHALAQPADGHKGFAILYGVFE